MIQTGRSSAFKSDMSKTVQARSRSEDEEVGTAFVWFDQYNVDWAEVTLSDGRKLEPKQIEESAHLVRRIWIEPNGDFTGGV